MTNIFDDFLSLLAGLSSENWNIKVNKNWTIKDVVAHLVAWEKEAVESLRCAWDKKEKPWFLEVDNYDAFNERAVKEYRDYSSERLVSEWKKWQSKLDAEVADIGEENLRRNPELFSWVFDEGENSHYLKHLNQIKKALE